MVFGKIFKKKKPKNEAVIDLGKLNEIQNRTRMLQEATQITDTETDTGFLGNLASAASTSDTSHVAVSGIDPEKIERLNRRIDTLIDRFELIERKLERIERRVDLKY